MIALTLLPLMLTGGQTAVFSSLPSMALVAQARPAAGVRTDLTLDDIVPEKPYSGKAARGMEWSPDDRYVAYLWNPYDDKGFDLWIYDIQAKTAQRVTSLEMMTDFDREAITILERYKKEKAEEERRKKLTDAERKKLEDEERAKKRELQMDGKTEEAKPDYQGIGSFEWAHNSEEMLFNYKGDIYRIKLGDTKPTRLTKTKEPETGAVYTKDDSGMIFARGGGVFRMRFDSPVVDQLNPDLPQGMSLGGYSISPDETKMMITSYRSTGPSRQVTYISYRNRFAEARTTERDVADDPFNGESYMYLYDLNDDPKANPKNDGKPWEIYHWPAGHEYGQTSLAEKPWSEDSKKFVFSTWKRDKRELEVVVADLDKHAVSSVYKEIHKGGSNSPGMSQPFFTSDGSKIIALLEDSGFRHAWVIDPVAKTASQLTKGDFEAYPLKLSKDGQYLFVTADKEHSSRNDVYRVSLADGTMQRLTSKTGSYGSPALSHDTTKMVAPFRSWSALNELYLLDGGNETAITTSQTDAWKKVYRLAPQPFEFKDRRGYTVHGYLYLPPDYKKTDRRPLFMYTYGGPLGTSKDVTDGNFNQFNMYLAYKYGYITCSIDPRGMSGYGADFENANWERPGKAQVEDLSDAVHYLEDKYNVDPQKVGINGWSFGGFQTQMCMYTAPDVFKLGIAGAGPTQWQNYNNWYSGGVIGYSPVGKPDDLDRFSLIKLSRNLQGPLMLLHGMEDTNVLFQDTVKVYQALLRAEKGPLVELVLDPTGSHGLGGDIKTKQRLAIYEEFLMKHWGPYRGK